MEFSLMLLQATANQSITRIDIINCIIAALSLLLSGVAIYFTVRAELRFSRKMDCKISVQQITNMYAIDVQGQPIPNPFKKEYNYLINLNLINPSSSPMSYFALNVVDQNNRPIPFPVQAWSDNLNYNTICCLTLDPAQNTYPIRLMLPPDTYGTLQPYTFLPITLAVRANAGSKIRVYFKTCKPRCIKNGTPTSTADYPLHMYEITLSTSTNIVKLDIPTEAKEVARGRQHKKYKKSKRGINQLVKMAEEKEDGKNL